MRHHDKNRKLGRKKDERGALIRGLAVSLVERGKIKTTEAKAKELRPFVEGLVTKARSNTVSSKRLVMSRLQSDKASKKLFDEIAPRYKERPGGYTRITKLSPRQGDASRGAVIEFV